MLKQCITLWNTGPYLQGNTDPLERWSFCAKLTAGTLADGGNTDGPVPGCGTCGVQLVSTWVSVAETLPDTEVAAGTSVSGWWCFFMFLVSVY